jgi:hypothetical protein
VAKCEDTVEFILWDATSDYLVSVVLEQFRIFPKVESNLLEEAVLVLLRPMRWNLTCGYIIDDVSIPRWFSWSNFKQLLIRKGIMNWN